MRITLISVYFICLISSGVFARPVSYPDGWTLMQMNDAENNSLHVHYSPTRHYSIGYKAEYHRDADWQFHGGQLNYLVQRWNAPSEQANLYFKSGAGLAIDHTGDGSAAAFAGIAADWETRRYFTSYENRYTYAEAIEKHFSQKARIGIAPYIGDYGDYHTWLMLQLDHHPTHHHEITLTPLVRLFKGDIMAEAGMSNRGTLLLNSIVRF